MFRLAGPPLTTRRTSGDKSNRTHLLRSTCRDDGKVKNERVGNLSHLPEPVIALIRQALRGEALVNPADGFEAQESRQPGARSLPCARPAPTPSTTAHRRKAPRPLAAARVQHLVVF